jgi:hypothetical protein
VVCVVCARMTERRVRVSGEHSTASHAAHPFSRVDQGGPTSAPWLAAKVTPLTLTRSPGLSGVTFVKPHSRATAAPAGLATTGTRLSAMARSVGRCAWSSRPCVSSRMSAPDAAATPSASPLGFSPLYRKASDGGPKVSGPTSQGSASTCGAERERPGAA